MSDILEPQHRVTEATLESFQSTNLVTLADKIYSEAQAAEESETGVELLLAGLEEGMPGVEVVYIGELLAGTLVDYSETEAADAPEQNIDIPIQFGADLRQRFEEEFNLYLETLEPAQVAAVQDIIEAITLVMNADKHPSDQIVSEEQVVTRQLEELCIELYECLGLEYDQEIIKQFVASILVPETHTVDTNPEELTIEILNKRGTYEYKHHDNTSLLSGLTKFIKQRAQPYLMLGRYTLALRSR